MSAGVTVREADFHNLGSSLDRLHALVHMFEAAQLLDHIRVTDANRPGFHAAMEAIVMITDEARSARAHFNAASGSL